MIEVVQPGLLTTIQDAGRPGFEVYGMPPSGPLDPFLAAIANKLVGNKPEAALLEFALLGPSLKFRKNCWVSLAAFSCSYLLDGDSVPEFSAFPVESGSVLQFNGMKGWFGYMAVSGSLETIKILNSSSAYLAGGIGKKLEKHQQLSISEESGNYFSISPEFLNSSSTNVLSILPGLHTSLFHITEHRKLAESEYKLSPQSNRMGILMNGPAITALPVRRSAPALPGTIQIQHSGNPMILGPEGPTTGGYPQIAILSQVSWSTLARTRPGELVRFAWTDVEKARQIARLRNSILCSEEAWRRI
jgi:antagonist of KipI